MCDFSSLMLSINGWVHRRVLHMVLPMACHKGTTVDHYPRQCQTYPELAPATHIHNSHLSVL